MHLKFFLILLFQVFLVTAFSLRGLEIRDEEEAEEGLTHGVCGNEGSEEAYLASLEGEGEFDASNVTSFNERSTLTIETYAFIIGSTVAERDRVTDAHITAQMKVLNEAYGTIGIQFVLKGGKAKRVAPNADWANFNSDPGGDIVINPAVPALRKGTYRTLNLFFVERLDRKKQYTKGYCTFPQKNPDAISKKGDGCVIRRGTMPNWFITVDGVKTPYRGVTAIHEVGHWLGLAHTFAKGKNGHECEAPGDKVADTPYERQWDGDDVWYCKRRNTCPQVGEDLIHNFMTYGPDFCLPLSSKILGRTDFTPGQGALARWSFATYRAGK